MRFYVGAVLRSVADWRDFIDVKAPKNYKDPDKIADYIAKRQEELESETVTHPLAGGVSSVCILTVGEDGAEEEKAFEADGTGCGSKTVEYILDKCPIGNPGLFIGGCRIRPALRLMAIDYILKNGKLPFSLHWMFEEDDDGPYVVDPARMICGYLGPHVPEIPLEKVAKKFGLPAPDESSASDLAVLAYQLCGRLSFVS